jgi:protoheme ferro-lyase
MPAAVLPTSPPDPTPYDAVLLLSFGGPEKPEDVLPFLQNVTRGRGIPDERLREVGEHYFRFGGRSPINDQNRALLAALRASFDDLGLDLPIYWGNRNWAPYLTDTLREMAADGVRRAVTIVTSAYPSYSGCRQYRENLADAAGAVPDAPRVDKLRHYANHPAFVGSFVEATAEALAKLPEGSAVAYVTHSIPTAMNAASGPDGGGYEAWHRDVAAGISAELERRTGSARRTDLVYCSRSGPPQVPWLEPDVNDHRKNWPRPACPAWRSCRSASSATTWRSSTTSTPRRRRRPSGSACRWHGPRRRGPTPASWRCCEISWWNAPRPNAARSRPGRVPAGWVSVGTTAARLLPTVAPAAAPADRSPGNQAGKTA